MGHRLETARLWNAASGQPIATLSGHTASVGAVAFSPDGARVLTGSADNTVRTWPIFQSVQKLLDTVKAAVPRCLTTSQRRDFHLWEQEPQWCHTRHLWPYSSIEQKQ